MNKHYSKIVECTTSFKIECVHCKSMNYVSQPDDSGFDVEEITCWSCGKDSLVNEELLLVYPEYPNESTGACFEGTREP